MQKRVQGEQTVTIHPADAEARGITDGRYVGCPTTAAGSSRSPRSPTRSPSASSCARWARGRKNAKDGSTVNAVNPFVFADLGNAPTFSDTRVEVTPV